MTVEAVLERAGGLTDFADEARAYVIRADGNIENLAKKKRFDDTVALFAGDVLLVPRAPLERSFGAKFSDALHLARQAAEVAVLMAGIGAGDFDLTTILQPPTAPGVPRFDELILGK